MKTDTLPSIEILEKDEPIKLPAKTLATIVVVDDSPPVRRLAQILLEKEGYETILLESGNEALELAKESPPDLMLLDCQLPDLDGYEVCRQIKRIKSQSSFPIIFISGNAKIESKQKGFNAGGVDYITKPFDPMELKIRIKTHLDLAFSRKRMQKQAKRLKYLVRSQTSRLNQLKHAQESLLTSPDSFPQLDLAVHFQPALEAGGDFYDILKLSEDQYGFLVADVSGHDLGSAYITGALKALSVCFTNETLTAHETFFMLNSALTKFLDECQYATACYIKFIRSEMKLEIISAGHPAPIILRRDGSLEQPEMSGMVLGMMDQVDCDIRSLTVSPGDRLFLYTDGLIEGYLAENGEPGSREFGTRILTRQIKDSDILSVKESVNRIISHFFTQNQGIITDDVVLMGIEF